MGEEGRGATGLEKQCVVSLYLVSVETEDLLTPQSMVHELIGIFN